jgi:AraC family transcriptional regulator
MSPRSGSGSATRATKIHETRPSRIDGGSGEVSHLATHPAVAQVRTLLDHEYEQPWTAADLAAQVGLTPTYLTQIFTRDVGTAPHQYLIDRRIHRASQLLTDSDMTITAIAHATGFRSGQHLATAFRRITGHTPSHHRHRTRHPD